MKSNDFDSIASFYDILVRIVFQKSLFNSQLTYLKNIPSQAKVLIIGGGSGWIINEILKVKPDVEIIYIELSKKMLNISKSKIPESYHKKIIFIHGDETDIDNIQEYDVLITNFFLDVFSEIRLLKIVKLLQEKLQKKGLWILTDFVNPPKFSIKHIFQILLIKIMYIFFRLICRLEGDKLLDHKKIIQKAGLQLTDTKKFFYNMIEANLFLKQ
ncbi:MAG: class I SAM-dependent methyltransferase [Bacteroidota bacterium]|nr:class I SAM-dependent methyltransferase [Bacteroidota bacterium]